MSSLNYLGEIEKYKVMRETDIGYILLHENDEEEYFLHHNECCGRRLNDGQSVDAFLYLDKKGRPALTLSNPFITLNGIALLRVVAINHETGLFMNININKDILLSKDELPTNKKQWPKEDSYIPCEMRLKNNKLIMKIASKEQMLKNRKDNIDIPENTYVDAYIYRITDDGMSAVTDNFDVVFIYRTNYREKYCLGDKINVKIIKKNENDYSGTMIVAKEHQIQDDRKIILDFLNNNNGVLMLTEDSNPEVIYNVLHMSKNAFKHALGGLLKADQIEILSDKIILKNYI